MISSMTGYGRGEAGKKGITVTVELRSVNSRFLEVSTRLPRSLSLRENEIKEIIRKKLSRGKINVLVSVDRDGKGEVPLRINQAAAKAYHRLLTDLKKAVKSRETITLDHLLKFSDVLEQPDSDEEDTLAWELAQQALAQGLDDIVRMRDDEGDELRQDLKGRITAVSGLLALVEGISKEQVPGERKRLRERIEQIMERDKIDEGRLEMELALMADRLDVTEECVRFRSHNKFFLELLENTEPAGRKLNFLIQEMNREANTIGSKSSSTEIAHHIVSVKEELERIREQLQNIE
jgi:uncharacterized protein (TIGR00255 family)